MVLDLTLIIVGPQMVILDYIVHVFLLYVNAFYSRHNTGWIANMENSLDCNNDAKKRLCISYTVSNGRFDFLVIFFS